MNATYAKKTSGKIFKSATNSNPKYLDVLRKASAYPLGDGDCMRTCRLCGGEKNLRHFQDTYVWEGNEERYDDLLYDCFGIKVTPSDCMICDYCVHGLRTMEKFKALVFAAFQKDNDNTKNEQASATSSRNKMAVTNCIERSAGKCKLKKPVQGLTQSKQKQSLDVVRKKETKKWMHSEVRYKRVQCEMCKQRYPLLISNNEKMPFVCSRCKTVERRNVKKPMVSNTAKLMNLYTEAGHRRRAQRVMQKKSKTMLSLPKKMEKKQYNNTKYLKNNKFTTVETESFNHGFNQDNYFNMTHEEETKQPTVQQNMLQSNSDTKSPSLKFIFEKSSSMTKTQ